MKNRNVLKKIVLSIYIIGFLLTIIFSLLAIIGGNRVDNIKAMLPFTEFERYTFILAVGCILMIVSCIGLIILWHVKKLWQKTLIFVPGIITLIPFCYWLWILVCMMISFVVHILQ